MHHFLTEEPQTIPGDYLQIEVQDDQWIAFHYPTSNGDTFRTILETLCENYLCALSPRDYGSRWVLGQMIHAPLTIMRLAIVPTWVSAKRKTTPLSDLDPAWDLEPPARYGLSAGKPWRIIEKPTSMHIFGYYTLAPNDALNAGSFSHLRFLLRASQSKQAYFIPPAIQVDPERICVLAAPKSILTAHVDGRILFDPNELYRGF